MDLTEYGIVVIVNGFGRNKMKKDLILITAFCNNDYKTSTLRNLVTSLKKLGSFDILISSHSTLPPDIVGLADYYFYDSKNILLTDFDLRSASWFDPDGNGKIHSIFVGFSNTHLAIWRLLIFGHIIAKSLGYVKIHHVEYDAVVNSIDEFVENSKLLETNDAVTYKINDIHHNGLLLGSFQSYRIDKLSEKLLNYNEEEILTTIRTAHIKSPEMFFKEILHKDKIYIEKPVNDFALNGIQFAMSKTKPEFPAWCFPYYDRKTSKIFFIVWNHEEIETLNVKIIYNDVNIYNITDLNPGFWRIVDLGNYEDTIEIVVLVNNKVRNVYDFKKIKETFKYYSYRE